MLQNNDSFSFPGPLVLATFRRRYKRFFLEAEGEDGEILTAHCGNSGSMTGLLVEGSPVLLTDKGPDHTGKLRYASQAIKIDGTWVGINTHMANQLTHHLLEKKAIPGLETYSVIRREVPYGIEESRIDFLLEGEGLEPYHLEVKSVTLRVGDEAQFPDAVSHRGQKHLRELMNLVKEGRPAGLLFLVQRDDCQNFKPAQDFDPAYAYLFQEAVSAGVRIWVISNSLSEDGTITWHRELPY